MCIERSFLNKAWEMQINFWGFFSFTNPGSFKSGWQNKRQGTMRMSAMLSQVQWDGEKPSPYTNLVSCQKVVSHRLFLYISLCMFWPQMRCWLTGKQNAYVKILSLPSEYPDMTVSWMVNESLQGKGMREE